MALIKVDESRNIKDTLEIMIKLRVLCGSCGLLFPEFYIENTLEMEIKLWFLLEIEKSARVNTIFREDF